MGRRETLRHLDAMYEPRGQIGDPCTYCGVVSDTMDHVPPLVIAEMTREAELTLANLRKVPACRECNSTLSGARILTIKERREAIKEKIRKKYRKFLSMPQWDDDELEEVSPEMAKYIMASLAIANHTRARLRWMK